MKNTKKFTTFLLFAILHLFAATSQTSIIAFQDTWKYQDNVSNQGTTWRATSVNDGNWKNGSDRFGNDISDANTLVSYGLNANKKYINTYLRKTITGNFSQVQQQDGKLINSGGGEYVDGISRTWSADVHYSGGKTGYKTFDVAGTTDDALYLYYRYASSGAPFSYNIPLNDGTYTLKLHFIEPYFGAPGGATGVVGGRIFHVDVEGQSALTNYDIYAQEGAGKAVVKTYSVNVADGTLNILFTSVVNNAIVSAIEVVSASTAPDQTPPTIVSINRYSPTTENTSATSVVFRATFSEAVTGVDVSDFSLKGMASGTIASVSGSGSTRDITVNNISGTGILGLDLNSSGTGITDAAGNAISGGFSSGQTYNITSFTSTYTLTVNTSGSGTVTKSPDQASYTSGTAVTLTATPASGYQFSGWSGDASGTVNPLIITMNSNKSITAVFTPVQQQGGVLVNSGGSQYVDVQSRTWSADSYYSGGRTGSKSFDVVGTTDDDLYRDYRYASSSAPFSYNIPLNDGTYTLKLHFMEPSINKTGGRVFHVDAEGQRLLTGYDIYTIDGLRKAVMKTFSVSVADGTLNILFTSVVNNAVVSAIEVVSASTAPGYTLTVNTSGSGTVSKAPDQSTYTAGTNVTLTATPSSGFTFSGWSGDATGTTNPLSLNMNSNKTITGNFTVIPTAPGKLTRGPYLQMVSTTAMTLRWRTDAVTDSKVEVGTSYGNYNVTATSDVVTTEHEVRVTDLTPGTKYFYRFGSTSQTLQESTSNYFFTAPSPLSTDKVRVAAFGDCGRAGSVQTNVLNAYLNFVGSNPAELMLLLGDNAYVDGTDAEYQSEFFTPYSSTVLKNHVLFPTPGNHDYHTTTRTARDAPYYKNFTLPTAAESGGIASGTEAYYSFNWGNIHFISLDSHGEDNPDNTRLYDTLGPQVTWVKKDLDANNSKWTIVYWHHPPFSKGSHNSDTEGELIRIRENFIRILERYGVDLVLCGHSHNYERSYLLNGYYGTESNFDPDEHAVSTSSGKYNGSSNSCPYTTSDGKIQHGTVYVVSGSSARSGSTIQSGYPHNALPFATNDGGMFYFEVEGSRLDAKMIHANGEVFDQFTIMKDVNKTSTLAITSGASTTLTASWNGLYQWSTGATTRSITVSPTSNTTYTVTDAENCLKDVFEVNIATTLAATKPSYKQRELDRSTGSIQIFPSLVKRGQRVSIHTASVQVTEATVVDNKGTLIKSFRFNGTGHIETQNLAAGMYMLLLRDKKKTRIEKFIVTD